MHEEKEHKLKTIEELIKDATSHQVELTSTAVIEKEESLSSRTLKAVQAMTNEMTLLRRRLLISRVKALHLKPSIHLPLFNRMRRPSF